MRRLFLTLATVLAASAAQAYDEFGYFTGAYAIPGNSGCTGAVAQGVNPYGGCTTGNLPPLTRSQADLTDYYMAGTYSHALADLNQALLMGSVNYPSLNPNGAQGTANLKDRLTVVGNLPAPVNVEVDVLIKSNVLAATQDDYNAGMQLSLQLADGTAWAYIRTPGTCFWALRDGNDCDNGIGPRSFTLTKWVTVSDSNRSFNLASVLETIGGGTPLSAEAHISVLLPQGLSYTSASGVFPSAVPEPAGWMLWLAGLGCAALRVRRQRAA